MSGFLRPRIDILPAAQQQLWPKLGPARRLGFVLYGGTAIALRLAHRPSADFDFFTEQVLDRRALSDAFPLLGRSTVLQDQPDTFTVLAPANEKPDRAVKISFFGAIGFGRVGEPQTTDDGVMQVASLDDLMATKVKVMLERVESRDYKDVAAMIEAGVDLAKGLGAAREMYGSSFQPSECLKALVYFQGGDLHLLSHEERQVLVTAASAVRELPQVRVISRALSR